MRQSPRWGSCWWRHLSMSDNIWSSRGENMVAISLANLRSVATEVKNTSGGPATQNVAARSHTSELTRGRFCFRVSTGEPRWAPQVSRASSGRPGAGKTKGSRGLSDPSQYTSLLRITMESYLAEVCSPVWWGPSVETVFFKDAVFIGL